jgi:Tfp pilus assembly protein PilP
MKRTVLILISLAVILALPSLSAGFTKPQAKKHQSSLVYPYFLKRNPFQTFLYTKKPSVSFKVGEIPLLQYSLSSLKIVGIMERRGKYFAMIQTPDNRSYIVTVGSIIGVGRARIVSINDSTINLVENTYNALGQMRAVNVVMRITK